MKVSKKGLISRSISSLEDRGLVSTWESEDDKRVRRISLTDEAGPVIDQLNRGIREINEIVLSDISEEEIRKMEETMEKIMRNFRQRRRRFTRMTMNREVDLGKEPVKHLLFILAVPAITSQVVNALYNMVDRMYIGP